MKAANPHLSFGEEVPDVRADELDLVAHTAAEALPPSPGAVETHPDP